MKGRLTIDGEDYGECDFDIKFNSIEFKPEEDKFKNLCEAPMPKQEFSCTLDTTNVDIEILDMLKKTVPCIHCGKEPMFLLWNRHRNTYHCNYCGKVVKRGEVYVRKYD